MKKLFICFLTIVGIAVTAKAQTRGVLVNTNSVVVSPTNFWSADASSARSGLGLGSAATNSSSAFQPSSSTLTNLSTNNGGSLTNLNATNLTGVVALTKGGTGATNSDVARANLGLGWSALTNISSENFFNSILVSSDESVYPRIPATQLMSAGSSYGGIDPANYPTSLALKYVSTPDDGFGGIPPDHDTWTVTSPSKFRSAIEIPLSALTNTSVSNFRSAIGIPLPSLTNTNNANFLAAFFGSNTNPVLVNTNGSVVSPTNFWQVAPILTIVTNSQPVVNATNTMTNSRSLIVYSLTPSITGVTNTILLPTNSATFEGDEAIVGHYGGTNTATIIRQAGSTNTLITLSNYDYDVKFIYYNSGWDFYHDLAFVEPMYFAGADSETHIAETRTNLRLGMTNNVTFSNITASGTLTATGSVTFHTNLTVNGFVWFDSRTNNTPTNAANFAAVSAWIEVKLGTNGTSYFIPVFK